MNARKVVLVGFMSLSLSGCLLDSLNPTKEKASSALYGLLPFLSNPALNGSPVPLDNWVRQTGTTAAKTVSATNGGYVQLGRNVTLTIPAGALAEDTAISITSIEKPPAADGVSPLLLGYRFGPAGLQFQKPVDLTICYPDEEIAGLTPSTAQIYYADETGLVAEGSHGVQAGCVTTSIEHFSVYVAGAQSLLPTNNLPAIGGANFLPGTLVAGIPAHVRAVITDLEPNNNGAIVSAFLFWRIVGAPTYTSCALQPDTSDTATPHRYGCVIPAASVTPAGIQYFFQATDNLGATRTTAAVIRPVPRTANFLRYNPTPALRIVAGFSRDLTLQVNDSAGANQNISAEGFSVSGGIGSASKVGPSTVRFTADTVVVGGGSLDAVAGAYSTTLPITVEPGQLARIEILDNAGVIITGTTNVNTNQTYSFDAMGYDAYGNGSGNPVIVNPGFFVLGGIGSVAIDGTFTAGATPGDGFLVITLGTLSDSVPVSVAGGGVAPGAPTVAVTNTRNLATIQTGFLIGTAADDTGVALVEVATGPVGGPVGAFAPAVGTTNWSFKLPSGAATWKRGSKHEVHIRSRDIDSNYSAVTVLTVTKGENRDINGDGYPDAVMSDYALNTRGMLYVFHSTGAGGIPSMAAAAATTRIDGETLNQSLGFVFAVDDINGDGFADVAATAYEFGSAPGRAYIFLSAGPSGIASGTALGAQARISGYQGTTFGYSLALGDVNGDGTADVIVGDSSGLYVFHASAAGLTTGTAATANTSLTFGANTHPQIRTGDENGDGFADLFVRYVSVSWVFSYPYVTIVRSTGASGIPATPFGTGGGQISGYVGMNFVAFHVVDLNADGFDDVVLSYAGGAGTVLVFNSRGAAGIGSREMLSPDTMIFGEIPQDYFGMNMVAGDMNSDGYPDLAVLTYANTTENRVARAYLFLNAGSAGFGFRQAASAEGVLTAGSLQQNLFGMRLTDFNGDGYADLLLTEVGSASPQSAYIFNSSASGIAGMPISAADSVLAGEGNGFGLGAND